MKNNMNNDANPNNKPASRRRTKILATINPRNITKHRIEAMIAAGLDATRHNLSHGSIDEHLEVIRLIRQISAETRPIGIVVDVQGPKLRILDFKNCESVALRNGHNFVLDIECGEFNGSENSVGLDYKDLVNDVAKGDLLALADGLITLEVKSVSSTQIVCKVVVGGKLFGRKGINKIGGGLSAPALTQKDRDDIKQVIKVNPDYIALSFVKTAADIKELRQLLASYGSTAGIIAKIERKEAINNIEEIVREADVIMVARGDLGVEVGDPHLPGYQKRFIKLARSMNRCVITATQMMESMISNPIPTRAEVFDVANAVLDGTDTVMLSGETAAGKYPVKVISTMANIVVGAEQEKQARISHHRIEERFGHAEETIAMSAMFAANHHGTKGQCGLEIKAILALTESGQTCIYMSRISSGVSIYALSPNLETVTRLTLYRGVYPVYMKPNALEHDKVVNEVVTELKTKYPEYFQKGDQVLFTKGRSMGQAGGTSMLQIVTI